MLLNSGHSFIKTIIGSSMSFLFNSYNLQFFDNSVVTLKHLFLEICKFFLGSHNLQQILAKILEALQP